MTSPTSLEQKKLNLYGLISAFGPAIPFPTRPAQRGVRNEDFSFKSATKLRSQMLYTLI